MPSSVRGRTSAAGRVRSSTYSCAVITCVTVGFPSSCRHAGSLPSTLGALPDLLHFDVSSNSLSGPLPSELGSLTQLTYFAAGSNAFNGTVPTAYSSLSSLVYLDLQSNPLSGGPPLGTRATAG